MMVTGGRRWLVFALFFLLLASGESNAQQNTYVDPVLRMLLRPGADQVIAGALRAAAAVPPTVPAVVHAEVMGVAISGTPDAPRVGLLIRTRDAGGVAALRAAGAEIGAIIGDIVSATVPLSALSSLMVEPSIATLQAARVLGTVHDSSMRAINAQQVRQPSGDTWVGIAGEGAIVGIYDSGVDYTHGDFRTPGGQTRVLGLWDQTLTGGPPAGFTYGFYCPPATLDSAACPQRDVFGHGTHVAGSAAGDGSAGTGTPFQYAGVAPLASLIVVKGGEGSFAENRIIDGIDWIFREATRLGMPAVVNLSIGGLFGPHDGTRLFELAIDQLSGEGRIVVTSAGNDGSNQNTSPETPPRFVHAEGMPSAGTTSFTVRVPPYSPRGGTCNDIGLIDIWYESADRLTVAVIRPDGTSAEVAFGQALRDDSPNGQILIENAPGGQPYPENGDFEAVIRIGDCDTSGPPVPGDWIVRITPTLAGSGRPYHMWIATSDFGGMRASGLEGFNNRMVVGSPGNARRAITVGAFVTRLCFPSQTGQTLCLISQEELGDIAVFSSPGPTRDDRLKPEITAPGRLIISSLSGAAQVPENVVVPSGAHWVQQGTSMSSPHVAGTVALLLQAQPLLTPEVARDVITRSAIQDAFTLIPRTGEPPGVPNNQWGFGKLDARGALTELGALDIVATVTLAPEPIAAGLVATSRQGARMPLLLIDASAQGVAAARIDELTFEVTGNDPEARVVVVRDVAGNGVIDPDDPVLGSAPAAITPGDTARVTVPVALVLAPGETARLIAGIEFSGRTPHSTAFQMRFRPGAARVSAADGTGTVLIEQPGTAVASPFTRTTVLAADQIVSISENPVRSDRLIINFRQRPSRAAVYTVAGRLVADVLARTDGLRVEWDLSNDDGSRIVPGVYLLIVESPAGTERMRLLVLSPAE